MRAADQAGLRLGAVGLALVLVTACVPAASSLTLAPDVVARSGPIVDPAVDPTRAPLAATQAAAAHTLVAAMPAAADAVCPDPGATIPLAAVAILDPACIGAEVRVAGWWDRVHALDGDAATLFAAVLRDRLPGTRASHRVGAWAPLQTEEADETLGEDRLLGEWVTARVRLEQDELCRWVFAPGGEWDVQPPTWTCPRHLQVISAMVAVPPAGQLEACPDTDHAIPVERFVQTPRACFGTRHVHLRGWFDTAYIVSGWMEPWTPVPAWLWSHPMGRVPMLSPTSNPLDSGALHVRIKPGSSVEHAARNRWVVATGHYARPSETEACRARSLIDGTTRPPGAPTRAEARAACARQFVLVSLRTGAPS